jgi:hypothetical protein
LFKQVFRAGLAGRESGTATRFLPLPLAQGLEQLKTEVARIRSERGEAEELLQRLRPLSLEQQELYLRNQPERVGLKVLMKLNEEARRLFWVDPAQVERLARLVLSLVPYCAPPERAELAQDVAGTAWLRIPGRGWTGATSAAPTRPSTRR